MDIDTIEFAEALDKILSNNSFAPVFKDGCCAFSSFTLAEQLKRDGFATHLGGYSFMVSDNGADFLKSGGYTLIFKKKDELYKLKEDVLMLQKNELEYKDRIRKYAGVILMWKFVSAIIGLIGASGWILYMIRMGLFS